MEDGLCAEDEDLCVLDVLTDDLCREGEDLCSEVVFFFGEEIAARRSTYTLAAPLVLTLLEEMTSKEEEAADDDAGVDPEVGEEVDEGTTLGDAEETEEVLDVDSVT